MYKDQPLSPPFCVFVHAFFISCDSGENEHLPPLPHEKAAKAELLESRRKTSLSVPDAPSMPTDSIMSSVAKLPCKYRFLCVNLHCNFMPQPWVCQGCRMIFYVSSRIIRSRPLCSSRRSIALPVPSIISNMFSMGSLSPLPHRFLPHGCRSWLWLFFSFCFPAFCGHVPARKPFRSSGPGQNQRQAAHRASFACRLNVPPSPRLRASR